MLNRPSEEQLGRLTVTNSGSASFFRDCRNHVKKKKSFQRDVLKEMCHSVTQNCWRETRLKYVLAVGGPSRAVFLSGQSFQEMNRLMQ